MKSDNLKYLFIDMNAYFASVEQEVNPDLRDHPVAVAPVLTDSTCCIAASYEAKKFGIKTGTNVGEAKKLCPGLIVVEARHALYVEFHNKIIEAIERVIPIKHVHSIDEVSCELIGRECIQENAIRLGNDVKKEIKSMVGNYLLCSVGIAPNRFLSKIASNIKKPDGLTVITKKELPDKLYQLSLSDLPGIGRAMNSRLNLYGINTVEQLCSLPKSKLSGIWNSVVGRRWWHLLRGDELEEIPSKRRTLSHSHVLHPDKRTDEGVYSVLIKLIHKTGARLRRLNYHAGQINIHVKYFNKTSWKLSKNLDYFQDTQTMIKAFSEMWKNKKPAETPLRVSVILSDLIPSSETTFSLFNNNEKKLKLAKTMDRLNERYGLDCVYFGTMHDSKESAPMRIAFTSIPDVVSESTAGDRKKSINPKDRSG